MMKPILFNTEMVRAILDGRKTVTRRILKPQPNENAEMRYVYAGGRKGDIGKWHDRQQGVTETQKWSPPYHAGDIIYVRETWTELFYVDPDGYTHFDQSMYYYAADGTPDITLVDADGFENDDQRIKWKPSIHMPKEAARIFLRVKRVRVERLNQMQVPDYIKEGTLPRYFKKDGCRCIAYTDNCENEPCPNRDAYETLLYSLPFSEMWDSTIKPNDKIVYGYTANPGPETAVPSPDTEWQTAAPEERGNYILLMQFDPQASVRTEIWNWNGVTWDDYAGNYDPEVDGVILGWIPMPKLPKQSRFTGNGACITGLSPTGHCGAAACCSTEFACCSQCDEPCNCKCGFLPED